MFIRYAIYSLLILLTTLGVKYLGDYPVLQTTSAIAWCVVGALFIHRSLTDILKKR